MWTIQLWEGGDIYVTVEMCNLNEQSKLDSFIVSIDSIKKYSPLWYGKDALLVCLETYFSVNIITI